MKWIMYRRSGFTLLEVMVAVSIVAILATVVLASLAGSHKQSRDMARVSQVKQLKLGLRLYKEANGTYPSDSTYDNGIEIGVGNKIDDDLRPFVSKVDGDPLSKQSSDYGYWYFPNLACNGQVGPAIIVKQMENSKYSNYDSVCGSATTTLNTVNTFITYLTPVAYAFGGGGGGSSGGGGGSSNKKYPANCDYFNASPSSLSYPGGDVTLSWGTSHANQSVSIDHGIGSVSADGSRTVTVSKNVTYTLHANGSDGNDSCTASISVADPSIASCDYFNARPTTTLPVGGGYIGLSWGTTRADTVTIDHGIGTVSSEGEKIIHATQSVTYTLTAQGKDGDDSCTLPITVAGTQSESTGVAPPTWVGSNSYILFVNSN